MHTRRDNAGVDVLEWPSQSQQNISGETWKWQFRLLIPCDGPWEDLPGIMSHSGYWWRKILYYISTHIASRARQYKGAALFTANRTSACVLHRCCSLSFLSMNILCYFAISPDVLKCRRSGRGCKSRSYVIGWYELYLAHFKVILRPSCFAIDIFINQEVTKM